jgi:hypothetical protein
MSKLEEKIALYNSKIVAIEPNYDKELLSKVTRGLGPSIYNKDAECIACSNQPELDTVRKNFCIKKLGLTNSTDELNDAIKAVCEKMGTSNRTKYRAIFYYLLAVKFNKQSIYS